ncbi:MgtC/SapB family protein [Acidobacteriota bacterium]
MNVQGLIYPLSIEGVFTALICGLIIGLERQLSGKPTGIRTCSLICLGTYVFVAMNQLIQNSTFDPARIISQIITGIGFIGAGVILTRQGVVIGITSAAVIWVLAGIGVLIGFGKYTASIFLSVVTVSILIGINLLEKTFSHLRKGVHEKLSTHKKKIDPHS